MTRSEKRLVCVGLLVIAAGILYETIRVPDLYPVTVPQTDPVAAVSTSVSRYAVNLNEASAAELAGLAGITQELAQRIADDRSENGRFSSVDDLLRVKGIGPKTLDRLRPYVTTE